MIGNKMRPIHPGEILREEYLSPLGMSVNSLAKALNVTPGFGNYNWPTSGTLFWPTLSS